MRENNLLFSVILIGLIVACSSPPAPTAVPSTTLTVVPTPIPPAAYHPLEVGDMVEGVRIGYQYTLPSPEQPVVVIAFGDGLLELVSPKPELKDGLIAYIRELAQEPRSVYAFDEADPNQPEPTWLTLAVGRPIEFVVIPIKDDQRTWSVTETGEGEVRAAYKLVRRKDGGLRFIDAYGTVALNSFTTFITLNGGGAGLVFSARLALLRMILSDATYQRGTDVMASRPPAAGQYDPRILKTDPTKKGLEQNTDWVLVSRPGPNPGFIAP